MYSNRKDKKTKSAILMSEIYSYTNVKSSVIIVPVTITGNRR